MWNLNSARYYNPYFQNTINLFNPTSFTTESSVYVETISNVDLYYQPLQNPTHSITYVIICIIIIIIGEYVHIQVLAFLSRENSFVKEILEVFMYTQMVYWPVTVILQAPTEFVYPLREIIGEWYCIIKHLWVVYGMTCVLCHSFVAGLTRYVFVVHNERALKFGKERTKKMFFWVSILMPLVVTTWGFFHLQYLAAVSRFNKCQGIHHNQFLIENSIEHTTKRNFCFFEGYKNDDWDIQPVLKCLSCASIFIVYATMASNLVEGWLYWRTVKHSNRQVKQNK